MTVEPHTPASWREIVAAYQGPDTVRSVVEILLCVAPLALIWGLAWYAVAAGMIWVGLLLTVPASGFVLRLFIVQHDCGHGSLFRSRAANDWTGRLAGIITFTPYDCWRHWHASHHATSGDLDRRNLEGIVAQRALGAEGAIATHTVAEYRALPPVWRAAYRIYRHPLALFGIGPAYLFGLEHRLPVGQMRSGWRPWASAMGTNAGIALFLGAVGWLGGWKAVLLVPAPTALLAATAGIWFFYVHHQFEHGYWARGEDWNAMDSAMRGSSHYDLPAPLAWISGNIGVHHVHHLNPRVPFYRLRGILRDHPELRALNRITLRESLGCAGLALWDQERQRLVGWTAAPAARSDVSRHG